MPGRTFHQRLPEPLTFSFSHLCELTRELNISLDQSGGHSQIDRERSWLLFDVSALERTLFDRPVLENVGAQAARQGDAGVQRAFAHSQPPPPSPDAIRAAGPVHGGFDQRPPQPR